MVSTHFSRTTRAIHADNLQPVLVGLTFLTLLMLGWTLWFFLARIQLYETSQTAQFTRAGVLVADFPAASLARIRRGQSAFFHPDGDGDTATAITAIVVAIDPEQHKVRLQPQVNAQTRAALQKGATGQVEVVVQELSPASLIIQAAGLAPVS